jgi:hypothetical protein
MHRDRGLKDTTIIMLAAEQPAPARRSLQADAMGNVNAVEGSYFNGVPINKICDATSRFKRQGISNMTC